ncbi:MAG: redoxin family protein [Pseudomonadota bacterium]
MPRIAIALPVIISLLLTTACGQIEQSADATEHSAMANQSMASMKADGDHSGHMMNASMVGTGPMDDAIVGMKVDDFQLLDETGKAHRLYYYSDAPAIVIMTQGNGCPIVRNAMPFLREVRDQYADKGVRFFLLNSNIQDNRQSIAAESAEFGFDIPVLDDELQLIGESLKVTRTAEIFVIDNKSKRVVYHGPVDDRLTYERQRAEAKHTYLADALDAVIAGKPVEVAQVSAPGCIVNFPDRTRKDEFARISYADEIVPILESKCVECHQPGGIGPWAMTSYEMILGFAPMIREVLRTDRMPPWHADPAIGTFLHDRSLEPQEITTLVRWIEAGAPRGVGPDPLNRERKPPEDWPLGTPDLVLELPAFDVPATGIVDYQRPAIPNPLTEGKWLRASTVKVGSRETVHHLLSGHMKEMPENGRSNETRWGPSVGGYAVGAESNIMREGIGSFIPAGGAIGFQMHYTPYGKAVTDRTKVGLYFYDEPPELMIRNATIIDFTIEIPPETARHEEVAYLDFPRDALLYFAFPHAHYRGQSSTLAIRYPDGREQMVLSLPRYDFNWQRAYEFEEPIDIPAGSKLIARYEYDNTAQNAANPDPSLTITWGEQSHEEMLFTAVSYRWKDETSTDTREQYERMLDAGRMFGMMDDNIDDVLQKAELKGRAGQRLANNFERLDVNGDGGLSRQEYAAVFAARRQGD